MNDTEVQALIAKIESGTLSPEELAAVDQILIFGTEGDGQAELVAALRCGLTLEQLVTGED